MYSFSKGMFKGLIGLFRLDFVRIVYKHTWQNVSEIYVDNIVTYEGKYGVINTVVAFIGTVEEPYINDFVRFLEEQGIQIHQQSDWRSIQKGIEIEFTGGN